MTNTPDRSTWRDKNKPTGFRPEGNVSVSLASAAAKEINITAGQATLNTDSTLTTHVTPSILTTP